MGLSGCTESPHRGDSMHLCNVTAKVRGPGVACGQCAYRCNYPDHGCPQFPPSGVTSNPNCLLPECRPALGRLSRFPPCSPSAPGSSGEYLGVKVRLRSSCRQPQTPRAHLRGLGRVSAQRHFGRLLRPIHEERTCGNLQFGISWRNCEDFGAGQHTSSRAFPKKKQPNGLTGR